MEILSENQEDHDELMPDFKLCIYARVVIKAKNVDCLLLSYQINCKTLSFFLNAASNIFESEFNEKFHSLKDIRVNKSRKFFPVLS